MKNAKLLIYLTGAWFLAFAVISRANCEELKPHSNFIAIPADSIESQKTKRLLLDCEEDMEAVVAFRLPVHARLDSNSYLFDGGTSTWIGDGYKIVIYRRFISLRGGGRKAVVLYGPSLTIEQGVVSGSELELSEIRLISAEEADMLPHPSIAQESSREHRSKATEVRPTEGKPAPELVPKR